MRNAAGQTYYYLVEAYREGRKVRQRTLVSLGRVEDGKLQELAHAVAKHTEFLAVMDIAKSMSIEQTFVLGPLLILQCLFERLGINQALERIKHKHEQLEISLRDVVFSVIAARFVRPSSKLAIYEELLDQLYPDLVCKDLALHQIYRAMDLLSTHKDDIEQTLYWHGRDLLSVKVDVVLYDLTTLRFESVREDLGDLRRFGYSKEMRTDCTQVVLGLLADPSGIPLGFEVYPGNTFEGKTLKDIVQKMRTKFRVRRFIFVADRGLFSKENLDELKSNKSEFLVGMRLGQVGKRRPELYDISQFTKVNEDISVFETTHHQDRCIVTWSKERAERDQKVREDILDKIGKKLSGRTVTAKTFVSNSNYRIFLKGLEEGDRPELDQKKIDEAARKDGFFAIVTNVKDKDAAEIFFQYKQLWHIEDSFGELKGTLKARPIFHWRDRRIVGHLTMCFLALLCEAHVTRLLRDLKEPRDSRAIRDDLIDPRQLSAATVMKELCEVRAVPVTIGKNKIWVRTDIRGHAAAIFQRLGLRIPPRLLKSENVVIQTDPLPATA
jgi:hypothetical protein